MRKWSLPGMTVAVIAVVTSSVQMVLAADGQAQLGQDPRQPANGKIISDNFGFAFMQNVEKKGVGGQGFTDTCTTLDKKGNHTLTATDGVSSPEHSEAILFTLKGDTVTFSGRTGECYYMVTGKYGGGGSGGGQGGSAGGAGGATREWNSDFDTDRDETNTPHFVVYINARYRSKDNYFRIGSNSVVSVELHNRLGVTGTRYFKLTQQPLLNTGGAVTFLKDDGTPVDPDKVYPINPDGTVSVFATGATEGTVSVIAYETNSTGGGPATQPTVQQGTATAPVVASQLRMLVAYARYDADVALEKSIDLPGGHTGNVTLVDGTVNNNTTLTTSGVQDTTLPSKVTITGPTKMLVDFVYSNDTDAWGKFIDAWKGEYDIILYSGHANSGQYFDIGPGVTKTKTGYHKGEPKNGYVVLKSLVNKSPVKLYVSLTCYPEVPYMMLDSACVRLAKKFTSTNCIGHRLSGDSSRSNREIAAVITAVLTGKQVGGNNVKGAAVLPHLNATDVGIDDTVTVAHREARRTAFNNDGSSAIWHNSGDRTGYDCAWANYGRAGEWHPYKEAELLAGAQGQPKTDKVLDDKQEAALGAMTAAADTVVVSVGDNGYLETVKDGDDTYDNAENPTKIMAGPDRKVDTSVTEARQFWLKFRMGIEGSSLNGLALAVLWGCIQADAWAGTTTFQWAVRQARE